MDPGPYPTHPSSATNTPLVLQPAPRDPSLRLPSLSSLRDPLAASSSATAKDMHRPTWDPHSKDRYAAEQMDVDLQPATVLASVSKPLDGDLCGAHQPPTSDHGVPLLPRADFGDMSLEDKTRNPAHLRPAAGVSPLPASNGRDPYFRSPSVVRGEIERDRGLEHARYSAREAHHHRYAEDTAHAASSLPYPPHHAPALQRPHQGRYRYQHHSPPPSPTRADRSCYPPTPSQTPVDHRPRDPSSSPSPSSRDRELPLLSMDLKSSSGPHTLDPHQRSTPSRQPEHDSGSLMHVDSRPRNSAPMAAPAPLQQRRLSWEHDHDRRPDYYYPDHATTRDSDQENDHRPLHTPDRLRPTHHDQHPQYSQAQDQHYRLDNSRRHYAGPLDDKPRKEEESLVPVFPHLSSRESRPHFVSSHPHSHSQSFYTPPAPPALPATSHLHRSTNPYNPSPQQRMQQPQPFNAHPMHSKQSDRFADGSTTQDSSYDSNIDDDDAYQMSFKAPGSNSFQFKFGTDMPSTVDLKSAVDCCEALCKFALHYSDQPSGYGPAGTHGSPLEPNERANLQSIRKMNTKMLVGLQAVGQSGEEALFKEDDEKLGRVRRSSLHLGPGPPSNEMVHEFAKAATSIFQLAVRIKAWVGKSPEERQVDEEINIIRAKRCLLMDSTLVVPTVDQHGNVQKDFVQASTSISKSFHERQRELEQQRQPPTSQSMQKEKSQLIYNHLPYTKHDQPQYSTLQDMDRDPDDQNRERPMAGYSRRSHSSGGEGGIGGAHGFDVFSDGPPPMPSQHVVRGFVDAGSSAFSESRLTNSKHNSSANYSDGSRIHGQGSQNLESEVHSNNGSMSGGSTSRSSKNSDVPHQKYRKRAKRTQPPGRCLSCDSSDTPEWRRGPDGARTLCNACGLHYAKLLKRQNKQQLMPQHMPSHSSQSLSSKTRPSSRSDQLQVITFPLRRPVSSLSLDPASEAMTSQRPNGSGSLHIESSQGASKSPMVAQRAEGRSPDACEDEDQVMEIKKES
ncbi:hypothetical protein BGZ72_011201 [Mortierella alpina]|nr:hypothetical protein BGZ72_011201 [Mortierella alpina]